MKNELKKFLEFNGKTISFLAVDGTYWIAVKPICEALGVDYIQQHKNLKDDKVLGAALCNHTMQVGKDQPRSWSCLPEFYIYGWLFRIRSNSEELEVYQWKCYELLYRYFHGTITERENLLKVKTQADMEIEKLELELQNSEAYKRIQVLKKSQKVAGAKLRKLDNDIVQTKMDFWKQETTTEMQN